MRITDLSDTMLEQTTRALCTASKRTYSLIGAATRHGPKRPAAAMRAAALGLLLTEAEVRFLSAAAWTQSEG